MIILFTNAHDTSTCLRSENLCQSVDEELGPDVSTGMFTALTTEGRGGAEVKVVDGREGGRREVKDTATIKPKQAMKIWLWLLECNGS